MTKEMNNQVKTIIYGSSGKTKIDSLNLAASCVKRFCHTAQICITEEIIISKDTYGKPHCNVDELFLSISYCESCLVCAVSTEPIGIDIEKRTSRLHLPEWGASTHFFDPVLWTKIESCSKILGKGLCTSLDEILEYVNYGRFVFREYFVDQEHVCTICQCSNLEDGLSPDIQQVVWLD